jgi:hypothetical protein
LLGEFENQIKKIIDSKSAEKIVEVINLAGKEFPCLSCLSKAECDSFKWFIKWFGNESTKH